MGKIKRLLDRFDEMGRYPIQELGYSRTWLMFSYLGAFLVHRCIIKPRTDSGGHGVELCTITPNNRDQVWERLTSQDMIAEELLEQCPEMAALHPSSVNTVRALTIRGKLCSAVLRMGVGGGFVDNGCSGGIFAGLDVDTGIVTTQGADLMEHRFLLHPTTGLTIPGFQVPQWEQVRRTVEEAVTLVPNAIIVGWDVAVTAQGPVLIEGNAYPSVQIMQTAGMQGLKRLWNSALRG